MEVPSWSRHGILWLIWWNSPVKHQRERTDTASSWLHLAMSTASRQVYIRHVWGIQSHQILMMGSEVIPKTLVSCNHLTLLMAQQGFIKFGYCTSCESFCNKLVFYGEELLAPCPTPSLWTTPYHQSVTAYSIYSQLPPTSGGRILHPQPKDAQCCGERDPHNMA